MKDCQFLHHERNLAHDARCKVTEAQHNNSDDMPVWVNNLIHKLIIIAIVVGALIYTGGIK